MADTGETLVQEAVDAALAWLALVDAGSYAEAWEASSVLMKGAITEAGLSAALRGARGPLGSLEEREVSASAYATELPGAPDGEYVVIETKARFAHKAHAVETVTPRRDPDGAWRVSGYFIR